MFSLKKFILGQLLQLHFCCLRFGDKPDCSDLWNHKVSLLCPCEAHMRTFGTPKQPSLGLAKRLRLKPRTIPTTTTTTTTTTTACYGVSQ
jgi:hypothetical protein